MRTLLTATLIATVSFLPAIAQAGQAAPAAAQSVAETEGAKLRQLFHDSDEASLQRNPINALYRGDLRYAAHLGNYLTDAYTAAEKAAAQKGLAVLATIDRAKLGSVDQIAYDVFRNQTETALRGFDPAIVHLQRLLPLDHFTGFQTFYPDMASGQGVAPFRTLADYENNLTRNGEYAEVLDRAIGLFREGMQEKVVLPRLVVTNMIGQFDNLIAQGVEGSVFYGPVKSFSEGLAEADQVRLRAAYATQIRDVLLPAHKRVRDFLANEYLSAARESVGLSDTAGGNGLYAYLIEANTTLPLKADEVHKIGLDEVARIRKAMESQKEKVGFKGTMAQFFTFLRTDKQFHPASADQLRLGYEAIGRRVDKRIGEQFSLIPKTPLEIRAVPAYREKTDAGGSYNPGTPDGTRPGVFYYNSYDLPSRYMWEMETLYLHEAAPGHHFQISLAQENEALPAFMRFGGNTAYVEGWALYAETLWHELGMETDAYQRMGGLSDEMLRAMRLVVDTGIHAKGWTRDQAIQYMLDNSPMSKTNATAEVERYIAMPGQALAYKIGQLTMSRLKAKAEAELGTKFDPRAFHAQVLDTGALTMPVLEEKIGGWIKAGGK